ncbi:hypothetical protein BRC83_03540 [Halobacteriales archaeon QS_1_68_17]|nr:MAG: hypothetical protein BRC83_03540 [Halobacteriales archaeon QS_1_68_17]
MTITAKVYVSHRDVGLTPTIQRVDDLNIKVVSEAGTDPENDMYFFSVEGNFEAFERALESDHTVEEYYLMTAFDDGRLYRIQYSAESKLLSPTMTRVGAITLTSESMDDGWLMHLRLPNRDSLYELWEFARTENVTFEIVELRQTEEESGTLYGLTEAQREALLTAYAEGYFHEPRDASLAELADALGISPTAVGGRLRRGIERLIEATLVEGPE